MRRTSFSPTSRDDRAARQQMFGAVDFRRFRQDGGAAMAHQQIDRGAQRRIGRDARIAVRTAALQREQSGGWPARVSRLILFGFGQDRLDAGDAFAHRFHGAAFFLDGVGGELVAALRACAPRAGSQSGSLRSPVPPPARRRNWDGARSRPWSGAARPWLRLRTPCRSRSCA